jgi:hypothetical protein
MAFRWSRKTAPKSETAPKSDDQNTVPVRHAQALGTAVMAWSDLEFEIDYAIWDLMDSPQALSACLTAQMISPIPKLNALQSLVRLYQFGKKLEDKLATFSGSIGPLIERRNRMIHDKRIWNPENGHVRRITVTARTRLKFMEETETFDDVMKFIKDAMKARQDFMKIRDAIMERRDATRALPPEQKPQLPRMYRRVVPEDQANGDG